MGLEVVSFTFGMILVLVAIFGGIEAKELKIPKAGRIARLFSGCAGCALIILGLFLAGAFKGCQRQAPDPNKTMTPHGPNTTITPQDPNTTIPLQPIILQLLLGRSEDGKEREIESKLTVTIGDQKAELFANSEKASDLCTMKLAAPKEYYCSINGYTKWSTDPNNSIPVEGGEYMFIKPGHKYSVEAVVPPSPSTQTWHAYLADVTDRLGTEPE